MPGGMLYLLVLCSSHWSAAHHQGLSTEGRTWAYITGRTYLGTMIHFVTCQGTLEVLLDL